MLIDKLNNYNIILGSASPRRKKLLNDLGINFSIKITQEEEHYPVSLDGPEIAEFLAKQKAEFLLKEISGNYLLITADTIVMQDDRIVHKPQNKDDAKKILKRLSDKDHKVISGVCIKSQRKEVIFSSKTEVTLNKLSQDEILYYIEEYKPYDKAGSYGIQEWIGYIGIKKIDGQYNNVVGLPTADLYQNLKLFI